MELLDINNDIIYFDCIQKDEFELKKLISLLTVNESYFFREDCQLELLANTIIPQLILQKSRDSIRILSAGCSTGEEAYSIAIALTEKLGSQFKEKLEFFAFDVDTQVIEAAKIGIYGKSSFRAFDKQLKNKYFKPMQGDKSQIDLSLRKQVTFFEHNLLNAEFPLFLRNLDIIFYRNVSIYFKFRTQKKVFEKLSGILNSNGYLFMSATETFAHDIGILDLVEFSKCFVFNKTNSNVTWQDKEATTDSPTIDNYPDSRKETEKPAPTSLDSNDILESMEEESSVKTVSTQEMDTRFQFNRVLELLRFNKQAEALDLIEPIEIQHPESKKLRILKARVLYELNRLTDARLICRELIEEDQWYMWPHLYLGLFASFENNNREFVKHLKNAIYIQPTSWPAHYYLAKYYLSNSSTEAAAREMRNVVRLLDKNKLSAEEAELFLEPLNFDTIKKEFEKRLTQIIS